jgi:hypothetical protein
MARRIVFEDDDEEEAARELRDRQAKEAELAELQRRAAALTEELGKKRTADLAPRHRPAALPAQRRLQDGTLDPPPPGWEYRVRVVMGDGDPAAPDACARAWVDESAEDEPQLILGMCLCT